MKFAVFSDVHANLPALNAVLDDIERHNIKNIFCLGDLVDFSPWQNECINLVRELNIPTVCGNHDERVAFDKNITALKWHSSQEQEARLIAINYSKSTLTSENRRFLKSLPFSYKVDVGTKINPCPIMFVHASTTSLTEYIYEDHPIENLIPRFGKEKIKVIISGHTHIAYVRSLRLGGEDLFIANPGAVGRIKKGQPNATWLEGVFEDEKLKLHIHNVSYNVSEVAEAIILSDIPDFYAVNLLSNAMES